MYPSLGNGVQSDKIATLAATTSACFGQFGARVVISPFVLAITAAFSVTKSEVGLVLTVLWATFALFQFPSGVLADRFGEKHVILWALGLTAIGSSFVAAAPTFPLFALAAVVLGVGTGLYFSVGSSLLSKRFEKRGWALGIHAAGGPLAGLVLPVVAAGIAAQVTWRAGIGVGVVVSLTAFVLVYTSVAPTPTNTSVDIWQRLCPWSALAVLSRPSVAFTTLVAALGMYVFQAFISFFPTFLREYHGFTPSEASLAFGLAFGLITIGHPVVGNLADEYGTTAGLFVPFAVATVGFVLVLFASVRPLTYAGICIIGLGITWTGPLQSRLLSQFPSARRASGFGLARSVFVLLGSVGNIATGYLAEMWGWPVAYGVVSFAIGFAAVLVAGTSVFDFSG